MVGVVASYLKPYGCAGLVLPALSRHVPATDAAPLSGPAYAGTLHAATPEVASTPWNVMESGWLYQPFASGRRSGTAAVTVGGVLSTLILISTRVDWPDWFSA